MAASSDRAATADLQAEMSAEGETHTEYRMVANPSYKKSSAPFAIAENPSYRKSSTSADHVTSVVRDHIYEVISEHESASADQSTSLEKPAKKPEKYQCHCNGTYLVACILIIVAFTGLIIAIVVAFTNIRAVETDIKVLMHNTEASFQKEVEAINSSIHEMFSIITNRSRSAITMELVEDYILTLRQGIFGVRRFNSTLLSLH